MPVLKRNKTDYPGVYVVDGTSITMGKPEKIYYVRYRKDGKLIEEKAGRQFQDDMTPARASRLRARRIDGDEPSNEEKREAEKAEKMAEQSKWTIDRLWKEYLKGRKQGASLKTDQCRYDKYLKKPFGEKDPSEIIALDAERLKRRLLKKVSPQTTKHVLNLLTWIVNYGVRNNLCAPLPFSVRKPEVHNEKTEDLSPEQLKRLLAAIDKDPDIQAANLMRLALFTGMRRGDLFKLQWDDIDFNRGHILIRAPKGGPSQKIPLNDTARGILEGHPRSKSPYVFPGRWGDQRRDAKRAVNGIKTAAGLPSSFRPLHGLRHVYASMLASSGEVDMYHLQKLLTHKSPLMTQRYAHLRDEALKKASNVLNGIIEAATENEKEAESCDIPRCG